MHMLEVPIAQMEQEVEAELHDNPALEVDAKAEAGTVEPAEARTPMPHFGKQSRSTVMERTVGDEETAFQQLQEQVNMLDLSDHQKELMEYLLGMLDSDGLLRKSPEIMAEELTIYQGIATTAGELQEVIDQLKTLDPAGIGAQSLQECLMIQVERKKKTAVTAIMHRILRDCFELFVAAKYKSIYRIIKEDSGLIDEAISEIRRLNPRPGADLGGTSSDAVLQVIPDFVVSTIDGKVTFTMNHGKIPPLAVAEDFDDLVKRFEGIDREKVRQREYEAFVYARNRLKRANAYITLLQLRFRTLHLVMSHIIERQEQFFLTGDDNELKPLLLREIADKMDYDISTISRACNNKYVQTEWGIFPMKHFFGQAYASTGEGEEEYTLQQIYSAMREFIEAEDKRKPLSDEKLTQLMKAKGFALARRTITKHRERMGIPVARLRVK